MAWNFDSRNKGIICSYPFWVQDDKVTSIHWNSILQSKSLMSICHHKKHFIIYREPLMMFQLKRTRKKTPFLIIFAERRKRHVKSHNFSQSLSLTYLLIYATIPSREITFFFSWKIWQNLPFKRTCHDFGILKIQPLLQNSQYPNYN